MNSSNTLVFRFHSSGWCSLLLYLWILRYPVSISRHISPEYLVDVTDMNNYIYFILVFFHSVSAMKLTSRWLPSGFFRARCALALLLYWKSMLRLRIKPLIYKLFLRLFLSLLTVPLAWSKASKSQLKSLNVLQNWMLCKTVIEMCKSWNPGPGFSCLERLCADVSQSNSWKGIEIASHAASWRWIINTGRDSLVHLRCL